ncbi:envelope stress response membrane protein PspC [Candidatus Hydrogenedentota bacterium]
MTENRKNGLYRARDGVIFGVCKGLAEYMDFSVSGMRIIAVLSFLFTGFWPVGVLYIVAAMIMKPEPVVPFKSDEDHEFYDSYMTSRKRALRRLKRTFDSLDRRIRRMESIVTAKDYDWNRRFSEGSDE